jgi:hypothetical protein
MKNIKGWKRSGQIRDDADFIRIRAELEKLTIEEMRDDGYLPIHELPSRWSTSLLDKKYSFDLTMYGVYVGKRKAQEFDFLCEWKLIKSR